MLNAKEKTATGATRRDPAALRLSSFGFRAKEASVAKMTRGNQRELARMKNAKKNNDSSKGKRGDDGLSAAARKQRDAEIMKQKQKKADESAKGSTKSKQ